jgi:hypothetical protein
MMTTARFTPLVLIHVAEERERQRIKWGEQNLPDGTSSELYRTSARIAREDCERALNEGKLTFEKIMMEEVCEVLAEEDPERLYEELIQVAAVCVQWAENLQLREEMKK